MISVAIALGSIIFTAHFDIGSFKEDKLSKFFLRTGFLLGGIPMIPILFGGYTGMLFLILNVFFGFVI